MSSYANPDCYLADRGRLGTGLGVYFNDGEVSVSADGDVVVLSMAEARAVRDALTELLVEKGQ